MRPALIAVLLSSLAAAQADPLDRPADPVVLSGALTDALRGVPPGEVVAFRYAAGAWAQVPVQVDERFVVDYAQVYNGVGGDGRGFSALAYADAGTFTGPDPDPGLDADDEVVVMAADAGDRAPRGSAPPGLASDPVEVQLARRDGRRAYVYLGRQSGGLDPAAGADYVRYRFRLAAGTYRDDYAIARGPNPEDTDVVTDAYARHFSDRWVSDEMRVGGGPDLLDRFQVFYGERNGTPTCARTEDTFSGGEGAFVTNKDGPVRAIRVYVGANSGPLTERAHVFYARREDVITTLRVHAIPSIHDVVDYEPGLGLRYTNNLLAGFLDVDGAPDADVPAGDPAWEAVTGAAGTVVSTYVTDTTLPGLQTGFYRKDDASATACTGDRRPIGMSGVYATPLPCTDPTLSVDECQLGYRLVSRRTLQYAPPDLSRDAILALHRAAAEPLAVTASVGAGGAVSRDAPPAALPFRLSPASPNPFGRRTEVTLALDRPAHVRSAAYDARGRRVATLYDGRASGRVTLRLSGAGLAPGPYWLRTEVDGVSATTSVVRLER